MAFGSQTIVDRVGVGREEGAGQEPAPPVLSYPAQNFKDSKNSKFQHTFPVIMKSQVSK